MGYLGLPQHAFKDHFMHAHSSIACSKICLALLGCGWILTNDFAAPARSTLTAYD